MTKISVEKAQDVLATQTGQPLNAFGGLSTLPDKSQTIFPPKTFKGHPHETLFFVPTRTSLIPPNGSSGLVVLTDGGNGPDRRGQWSLDFASDFGAYSGGFGPVFLSPYRHLSCPPPTDATFDLNYAIPGTVLFDPLNPGQLFMIYGGTNNCIGMSRKTSTNARFYGTIGVATSADEGHSWPMYAVNSVPLPGQDQYPSPGPNALAGAIGPEACVGPNCAPAPSASYGRYAVTNVPFTLEIAVGSGSSLPADLGDSQPSSFIDAIGTDKHTYVYTVENFSCPQSCKKGTTNLCSMYCRPYFTSPNDVDVISMARAELKAGAPPDHFTKWYGTNAASFSQPGLGGAESPIFPRDTVSGPASPGYSSCQAADQVQTMGTLGYVDKAKEYLLVFVCKSPTQPSAPRNSCSLGNGGVTWMYATLDGTRYNLSRQDKWGAPQEIQGAWGCYSSLCSAAEGIYDGWYPTLMSVGRPSARLATTGFAFSMKGCTNGQAQRNYESRRFTVTLAPAPKI
jgi:hypothetical protein